MWQQWFREPSLRFSTGDQVTVLKFSAHARQDMNSADRRTELIQWLDKSVQPGFTSTLAAEAGAVVRRAAVRLFFELEAASAEVVDARTSLDMTRAEIGGIRAASDAHAAEAEEAQAQAQAAHADAADARAAGRELHIALDAVRATRTWQLHDRVTRWSAFRWLARR
jgi:hypothetical protein